MSKQDGKTMDAMKAVVQAATDEQKQHILAFTEGMAAAVRLMGGAANERSESETDEKVS